MSGAHRFFRNAATVLVMSVALFTTSAKAEVFLAILSGPAESPPNTSLGTGIATIDFNETLHTMHVQCQFTGLSGNTTACHIHSATTIPFTGTAGVATLQPAFPTFPLGVTSGSCDTTLDMTLASSSNSPFVTANGGTPATAEAALLAGIRAGKAYFNIHTNVVPGGEIRGFLVPEPTSLGLIAVTGLLTMRRKRA